MIEPSYQWTPCDVSSVGDNRLPSVTVVVLGYNSREHLEACFRSLLALSYPANRLELMLVDNASSDDSLAFMTEAFPRVTVVRNSENYGFAKGNNIGARAAKGELVAFLNPDMRVEPDWLRELVKPLVRDPQVICAGAKILNWSGELVDFGGGTANFCGYGFQLGWRLRADVWDQEGDSFVLAPCGGAMIVDKATFLDISGFDEDYFAYYEDTDLGWRLWVMGYKVAFVPRAVAYHIHHGSWGQVPGVKTAVLYQRNAFSTMVKNYDDENLKRVLPVALLLYLRRAYLVAGVDPSHFRSESPAIAPHLHTEIPYADTAPLPSVPLAPLRASAIIPQTYNSVYYLRETRRTLRREGLVQLWRKTVAEVKRRLYNRSVWRRVSGRQAQRGARPDYTFVAGQALSHLIAADDLVRGLKHLMHKRQAVQRRRHRSDQEIFALFGHPFQTDYLHPHYTQTLEDLAAACGMYGLFERERE